VKKLALRVKCVLTAMLLVVVAGVAVFSSTILLAAWTSGAKLTVPVASVPGGRRIPPLAMVPGGRRIPPVAMVPGGRRIPPVAVV
jgi:hypothetical protein